MFSVPAVVQATRLGILERNDNRAGCIGQRKKLRLFHANSARVLSKP